MKVVLVRTVHPQKPFLLSFWYPSEITANSRRTCLFELDFVWLAPNPACGIYRRVYVKILNGLLALSLLASCSATGTVTGPSNPPPNNIIPPVIEPDPVENNTFGGLLNDVRSVAGVGDVEYDERLARAAQTHATDMLTQNYLSHDGLNGSTIVSRAEAQGYDNWATIGENIAQGNTDLPGVLNLWQNSTTGHRENNLNPDYQDFGFGSAGSGNDTRWVLMLGAE